MSAFEPVRDRLRKARRIAFVTGAGISQESGIPTFRGKDGLWRNHSVMRLATIEAFRRDPKTVWEWYDERRRNILAAEPNDGHRAIADLQEHASVSVLTQNIDGLHQRAGSKSVYELHGSIIRIRCTSCDFAGTEAVSAGGPPTCACGGMLRPDVVWFGEDLPQDVWGEAVALASGCDLMVVAGTSLAVSPANTLPLHAQRNGATLIEVNPHSTEMTHMMDLSVRDTSARALPELVSMLRE